MVEHWQDFADYFCKRCPVVTACEQAEKDCTAFTWAMGRWETISGVHESWYRYMNMWPVNPLDSGDYVVEIVGTRVSVSPDSFEGE